MILFWLLFAIPMPAQPSLDESGWLRLSLPQAIWQEAAVKRSLLSGLTTGLEVESEWVPHAGKKQGTRCLIEVRYDLWNEKLIVQILDAKAELIQKAFSGIDEFAQWLTNHSLRILPYLASSPGSLRVVCRILPFSQAEAAGARAWFNQLLKVPDPNARGQQDRDKKRETSNDPHADIFQVLMATGINRETLLTLQWRWKYQGSN